MAAAPIIIVCLRRPSADQWERRTDPFWEFGSFGCTGCHSKNLMNPKRLDELEGCRMAFAQGGPLGFRLVHLTPPVQPVDHGERRELLWTPTEMPFRYASAPLLIANDGSSDFPLLREMLEHGACRTLVGQFGSNFRSRRTPLPKAVAAQVARVYAARRRSAAAEALCKTYDQALPWPPPDVDRNRKRSYREILGPATKPSRCESRSAKPRRSSRCARRRC